MCLLARKPVYHTSDFYRVDGLDLDVLPTPRGERPHCRRRIRGRRCPWRIAAGTSPLQRCGAPRGCRPRADSSRQSPTVMSRSRPPLTARMVAARRNAADFIVRPAGEASQRADSSVKTGGSRASAMRLTSVWGTRGVSTQSRDGRITPATTSMTAQTRRLLEFDTPHSSVVSTSSEFPTGQALSLIYTPTDRLNLEEPGLEVSCGGAWASRRYLPDRREYRPYGDHDLRRNQGTYTRRM
jgi:hypothetical protein